MRFGASLKKVQHFVRDCYEAVTGSHRERKAMKEELAGFERLRRASEDEGIAQDGPIAETDYRDRLQRGVAAAQLASCPST